MLPLLQKRKLRVQTKLQYLASRLSTGEPPKLIVFLHIPKTAGSSVTRYLKACIGSYRSGNAIRLDYHSLDDINDPLKDVQIARVNYITGHVCQSIVSELRKHRDLYTFTILRDPIDRLRSQYFYVNIKNIHQNRRGSNDALILYSPEEYFSNQNEKTFLPTTTSW